MTAPPPTWTVEVESVDGENVADARLEAISDEFEALAAASGAALAGPTVGARVPTGTLWLALTVQAPTPEDAAQRAAAAFRQATAAAIGALRVAQAAPAEHAPAVA